MDKATAKMIQGAYSNNGTNLYAKKGEDVIKTLTQSVIRGPAANQNNAMFANPAKTITNFFDAEVP